MEVIKIMIVKEFGLDEVFLMSEIIDKMDIDVQTDRIVKKTRVLEVENMKDVTKLGKDMVVALGIDIVYGFIKKLHKAKNEVKELIENMTDLSKEEVSKMNLSQMKEFFTELIGTEGFSDFLKQAGESDEKK